MKMVDKSRSGVFGFRRIFWRSIAALLIFQALGWILAAGIAYLISDVEMARDFYSAHQTVKVTWKLLVPALAVSAGIGFLVVGIGTGISIWRYSRRLSQPVRDLEGILLGLSQGQFPAVPAVPPKRPGPADAAVEILQPLRARIQQVQHLSRDVQQSVLALNYRASGAEELTLKDLRVIAGQLDALTKDLYTAVKWFEI